MAQPQHLETSAICATTRIFVNIKPVRSEILGRTRPLSQTLRDKIIPGVPLDEVRLALAQAAGPSLSDILLEQREPKQWPKQ